MHFEVLPARDQAVIGIRQMTLCRKAHHVTGASDGFQTRMGIKAEAAPQNIRCQAIDRQRTEQSLFIT